jgi:hypothetical protein
MGLTLYVAPPRTGRRAQPSRVCKKAKLTDNTQQDGDDYDDEIDFENAFEIYSCPYHFFRDFRSMIEGRLRGTSPYTAQQIQEDPSLRSRVEAFYTLPHATFDESVDGPILDLFLRHSDCDGEFTTEQCATLYPFFNRWKCVLTNMDDRSFTGFVEDLVYGLKLAVKTDGRIVFA